jgi:hypothetical protein
MFDHKGLPVTYFSDKIVQPKQNNYQPGNTN